MPTRRWLAPAVGLSAAALAVGTSTAAFAATPQHTAGHVHARGDLLRPSGAHHLTQVSAAHHRGKLILHDTSDNWAGYAAGGGTFDSVSSSWVQPSVSCGGEDTYSSFWVGLDGDGTSSVEQTGTEADCVGSTAEYSAWYELYPAYPVTYSNRVRPGDVITETVSFSGSSTYTMTIKDATEGWTKTTTKSSSGDSRSSAEVIAEAPYSGGVLPLANFGTVKFSGSKVNGSTLTSGTSINMTTSSGTVKASTGALSNGAFSIVWKHR